MINYKNLLDIISSSETDEINNSFKNNKNIILDILNKNKCIAVNNSETTCHQLLRSLSEALSDEDIVAFLRSEMYAYFSNPVYEMDAKTSNPYNSGDHIIVLAENKYITISLSYKDPWQKSNQSHHRQSDRIITIPPNHRFIRLIFGDGGVINKWKADRIDFEKAISKNHQCQLEETIPVRSGVEIFLSGGESAYTLTDIQKPVVALLIEQKELLSPVEARYDMEHKSLHSVSAADKSASALQFWIPLLRELNHPSVDICATLRPLLNHRDHFVRWSATREMIAEEPQKAASLLDFLLENERHPDVRRAAMAAKEFLKEKRP